LSGRAPKVAARYPRGSGSTCPQPAPFGFRLDGTATVEAESQCKSKIAVDAEVFYFDSNLNVVGVADTKVVKLPGANKGD